VSYLATQFFLKVSLFCPATGAKTKSLRVLLRGFRTFLLWPRDLFNRRDWNADATAHPDVRELAIVNHSLNGPNAYVKCLGCRFLVEK
jgi:hypothetical protein